MIEHNAATPEGQRIVFRVGINLGDVIIEGDDIYGDGAGRWCAHLRDVEALWSEEAYPWAISYRVTKTGRYRRALRHDT
jgi:hypothetical protein